jgi:hypothetical protein
MDYAELDPIWNSFLMKLGYLESKPGHWIAETKELVIMLSHKLDAKEKDIYLDVGIFFKRLHNYKLLSELKFEDHDLGQGLWVLLVYMGEWEYYLNNLFCYDPAINSEEEIKNNIRELAFLFLTKVIPHIDQLDSFARQETNFEKEATWHPFLHYFRASHNHDIDFEGALYLFHCKLYEQRVKKDES